VLAIPTEYYPSTWKNGILQNIFTVIPERSEMCELENKSNKIIYTFNCS
jgi:hypothetical protein